VGNHNTALFWEYDTRLGRRWNIDPVKKEWESPYATFSSNPIWYSDILGNTSVTSSPSSGSSSSSSESSKAGCDEKDEKKDDTPPNSNKNSDDPDANSSNVGSTGGGASDGNSDASPDDNPSPTPDPDPPPPQREGGHLSPKSFNFTQSTSATYEAGVSGLFYEVNVKGNSPFGGFSERFNFQTLYVQFPSSTKDGRKYTTSDAARISAEAFNDAAKSVALKLKFYSSIQAARLTYRDVQNMVTSAAQFYINHNINAGATITNRPFGQNTIVTPAVWGR
jgi:hypothetical protein